ncbi:hypothetical protein MADA3029_1150047 [Vibrio nigripulchritudo MADA3029]|nr:hypothetical protein VIBNIMADA3020_630048 [Vibrio nigripulchritudo MADA3020]CCN51479.1 hypothetical protein VIBNIMADA3021_1080049 [Vibrio nigripulchritudo MADA3021]CCN57661.1 hypothetical protein MADA3029_1150047 [Vibrio nigripulchritudo MADA3029]
MLILWVLFVGDVRPQMLPIAKTSEQKAIGRNIVRSDGCMTPE